MNDPDLPPPNAGSNAGSMASPPCEIQIQNPGRDGAVAARRLRPWLAAVVAEVAPAADSLGVRFISDQEMRRLNASWRGKDEPTDVLSFPGDLHGLATEPTVSEQKASVQKASVQHPAVEAPWFSEGCHLGDIAISVPTARRQAHLQNHDIEREFRTLLLHGLLHCLGYDHETDDGTMKRLECRLRARWIHHD